MQPELETVASQWRAIMPLNRPRGYKALPDTLHPRLVDEVYPLSVKDVYTKTYKALIHFDVPGNLKHDLLVMLGSGPELHYLKLLLPNYMWSATDLRRARIWDQVQLERSTKVATSTKSAAYRDLITISVFLSAHSRDMQLAPESLAEALRILGNKAALPQLCADLVTAAAPYMKPQRKLSATRAGN